MSKSILVFPSTIDESVSFATDAKRWGRKVVGASSVENDPYVAHYAAWEKLPYINEDHFFERLKEIIEHHEVDSIFTPHAPTHLFLTKILNRLPDIKLMGESPQSKNMNRVNDARQLASEGLRKISALTDQKDRLREDFLASLLAYAIPLYGECLLEKIYALCAIFCDAPKGDVIEIGSFFGKSAYVLNRLAAYFNTGLTISVDPWNMEDTIQKESPDNIQALSRVWDWDIVFQGFLLTMQGIHTPPFNYIRKASVQAYEQYSQSSFIESNQFGRTPVAGHIAVLHIDGNHDEQAVWDDLNLWGSKVVDGGWIIFDDYTWSQGDGPRIVADSMKKEERYKIEKNFVAGGAAFFKVRYHSE